MMESVKLGEVTILQTGKTPPTNQSEYFNGDINWYTPGDLNKGKTLLKSSRTITDLAFADKKAIKINKDILLMTCIGEIGKLGITSNLSSCNQQLTAIIPKEKVLVDYLYYTLVYEKKNLQNLANNAVVPILNNKHLASIEIPLPDLSEQKAIAAKLDKAQEIIQYNKDLIEAYEALTQSLFLDMFGDPVKNEKGWEVVNVEDIAEKTKHGIKAGPFGSALKKEFYVPSGYKIYGQEQVIKDDLSYGNYYIDEKKYKELENCKVKAGDILISLVGTYGKVSLVPETFEAGIINPRLMKISPDKDKIRPDFLKYLLQSNYVKHQLSLVSRGGVMDIINVGVMKKILIPLPPISLQNEFAERIKAIEKQKALAQAALAESKNLFNALLQKSFGA